MTTRTTPCRILVLGGYGHFGGRICRALAADPNIALIVAGRRREAARDFIATLQTAGATPEAAALDHTAAALARTLADLRAEVVVHTGGPYQGQDYHVARACVEAGAHYIDLADGRAFVAGITALDEVAKRRDVLAVSGASTLPALSSAVVDRFKAEFGTLEAIESGIAPGQKTPRGLATLEAVLSYCGQPFEWLEDGRKVTVYGWLGLHAHHYPDFGKRWSAPCDVPDLELFTQRYAGVHTVTFRAALELKAMQAGMAALAQLRRLGLMRDWSRHAGWLKQLSDPFDFLGSDVGGMHLEMRGRDPAGAPKVLTWNLVARRGHGPEIPCIAAIVVAKKLAAGNIAERGAMPCMGLMSLDEFDAAVAHLDIRWSVAGRP
ncbi:MAG TPA: saccharopine dehydrogenase NADP-binding domain-containing protein [Burkholderiales bacterium]|jgi:saccharopine dehydrogenase-like NADP-dependent oxidoreductase